MTRSGFSGRFTTVAFMVICFLYSAIRLLQDLIGSKKWRYAATVLLLAGVALLRGGFLVHFLAWCLVVFAGCWRAAFREEIRTVWEDASRTGIVIVMLNFLLVVLIVFGLLRFVVPAFFVFSLAGALLLICLLERIEYLPGRRLAPRAGGLRT